jgi:hypothetical protein
MAKFYETISEDLQAFIRAQHIFFVGSAPSNGGHINVSPKGMDSFRIISESRVAYLDLTGSGNETSAHISENGRITIMFCAFDGAPNILRLYGKGQTVLPGTAAWADFSQHFTIFPGTRQIIVVDIYSVQTSCGYAVPLYDFVEQRQTLVKWAENKGDDGLAKYHCDKNFVSLDGLPTPLKLFQAAQSSENSGQS